MESSVSTSGKPAPYGKACLQCARAKCRCILRSTSKTCERCHRLEKECQPAPTVRKRKSRVTPADTTRLEQKLDGLVSLLSSKQVSSSSTTLPVENVAAATGWSDGKASAQLNVPNILSASIQSINDNGFDNLPHGFQPLTPHSTPPGQPFPYGFSPAIEPAPEEAEKYLDIFRTKRLKYFPFIHIPHDLSSDQLRREQPFLWLCIMAVSHHKPPQQYGLGKKVREVAAREILVEGERSMEYLTGLLVFVGWGLFQIHFSPFLTAYTNLALSLLYDMELHKPVGRDAERRLKCLSNMHPKLRTLQTRSTDHMRIALAGYLLSSAISTFSGRLEPMRWSPYLEEYWQALAARLELPNDECLLYQIRLQSIAERAVGICTQNRYHQSEMERLKCSLLQIKTLRAQLADVKGRMPPYLLENDVIKLQALCTEVAINEIAVTCTPLITPFPDISMEIVEGLYTCVGCIKAWFDIFFEKMAASMLEFSTLVFNQLSGCIFALFRLTLLNDPGFDPHYVRKTADFWLIMDQVIDGIQKAKDTTVDWPSDQDTFLKMIRGLHAIKNLAASKLLETDSGQGTAITEQSHIQGNGETMDTFPELGPWSDAENEIWLKNILGMWEL